MTISERPTSVRKDLTWSAIGYGVYMLSQIGIIMMMTRMASVEDVGRYGFAISVSTIVIVFCNLGLRVGHATDVSAQDRMGIYVATRILTTSLAFIAISLIALIGTDEDTWQIVILVAIAKCAEALSDLFYGSFQKAGRLELLATSMVLRGPISLMIFAGLLFTTGSLAWALVAQAFTWWFVALVHDYRQAARLEASMPKFYWGAIITLMGETFSLGIAGLFTALATNAPRVIVAATLGLTTAGIYTAIGFVLQVGTVFATSVSQAMASRLARSFHNGQIENYRRMTMRFAGLMAGIGIVAVLIASVAPRQIVLFAFGSDYAPYSTLFIMLTVALALRLVIAVLQTALIAQRSFRVFATLRVFVAAGIVSGCWLGATLDGLQGVAIAIIVVSLLQASVLVFLLQRGINAFTKQSLANLKEPPDVR